MKVQKIQFTGQRNGSGVEAASNRDNLESDLQNYTSNDMLTINI